MTPHRRPDSDDDESYSDLSEAYFSDASESETDTSSASDYGADAALYKDRGEEGEIDKEDEDDEDEDDAGRWL
ncbi:uncharacterized protein GIQ15_04282 [Arthroderma uncinatum]|uniref:uncharacterized protein n=1 Tax=Arthroderma uncinatum TaxID=74035 RepID=UPI00144A9185|nr:uncharacterized protein GIQ15_04282 [Arthroderma uncinatum]KAF3481523.1 hypothetical protein GIQ15_04282 [Arthroderma uncinatum]